MAKNGTVAYVTALPECDIHKMNGVPGVPAEFDFKTTSGPWANGCEACWKDHRAYRELGIGKGQRLVVTDAIRTGEHN